MQIQKLKGVWTSENISLKPATKRELFSFQKEQNVSFPKDLLQYFELLNGTNNQYDGRFFQFYSLTQFKSIDEELKNWDGVPDYSGIVETLRDYKSYFVLADYSFHMFSYAIRLNSLANKENEVLVLCGREYKKIASTFTEFIDLYLRESIKLQFDE